MDVLINTAGASTILPAVNVTADRSETAPVAVCRECGWLMRLPVLGLRDRAYCPRCGSMVAEHTSANHQTTMAWSLAALSMLCFVFAFGFLNFEARGISHTMWFLDSARTLTANDYKLLATLVLLTTVAFPALYLCALLYICAGLTRQRRLPFALDVARLCRLIEPWMMSDVFIVGVLVSLIKIVTLATIGIGLSFVIFCAYSFMTLRTIGSVHWPALWDQLADNPTPSLHLRTGRSVDARQIMICETCGVPFRAMAKPVCPRCGKRQWIQRINRLQLTWALLVTAIILYILANIYPIMLTTSLGRTTPQTIVGGVMELAETGSWPIALVVFSASIVVPITKIVALAWLCLNVRHHWNEDSRARVRLHRFIEKIGRWSMIDVFVVATLGALVQAGMLVAVKPGAAAPAFAAVVIITMIATHTFDTRLLWNDSLSSPTP
ncbi:MAG: PqiA/YebS family transporter subunit [Gammaproteobacteria bacterium]